MYLPRSEVTFETTTGWTAGTVVWSRLGYVKLSTATGYDYIKWTEIVKAQVVALPPPVPHAKSLASMRAYPLSVLGSRRLTG